MKLTISSNDLEDIAIGAMAIIIVGLIFMLVLTIFMLETGEPARMFPALIPDLWQAAAAPYG